MTTPDQLTDDREAFRQHAIASGEQANQGDEDAANEHTEAGNAIVARWVAREQAHELLMPLLDDPSEEVRFAAAAHLLRHGAADRAVPVLEAIDSADQSMLAPLAGHLLRRWHRQSDAAT